MMTLVSKIVACFQSFSPSLASENGCGELSWAVAGKIAACCHSLSPSQASAGKGWIERREEGRKEKGGGERNTQREDMTLFHDNSSRQVETL